VPNEKWGLCGSPNRDLWKKAHKDKLGQGYCGGDLDFVVIEWYPKRICAFLDYKKPWDEITSTEHVYYDQLMKIAPIYIVESDDPENGPFIISKYIGVNNQDSLVIGTCDSWEDYRAFENTIRGKKGVPIWPGLS
jgi:hypothetical protein